MGDDGVVLRVEGLDVAFPGRSVLSDVGFALQAGAFCGLIGANGSGKTSLLRAILGLQPVARGRVEVLRHGGERAIGYVPQKIALDAFLPMRAADLVALGVDGHRFGIPFRDRTRRRTADEMLDAVGAADFAGQRLATLSGGQLQRVLIAHALARRPHLLLLDEPLASLDLRSSAEIVALLRRLSREHGIAVLLSAHDLNPLLRAIDQVVYLARGRAASGPPERIVRTDVLSRLYGYHIDVIRVHGRILVVADEDADRADAAVAHDPLHVTEIP